MANSLLANPYYGYETGVLTAQQVNIRGIYWGSDQTAGADIAASDDILISDANGNRIWGKRAAFDGDGEWLPFPDGFLVNGITITTIDGGYFYIYIY